jgi:repressor LexA
VVDVIDELPPRQAEVLAFIAEFIRDHGFGPSVRDIMARFAIASPNGANCHLRALMRKGLITRESGRSRSIRLVGGRPCPYCRGTGRLQDPGPPGD